MSTPNNDSYVVRGREIQIDYNTEVHSAEIQSEGIGELISYDNPQQSLLELGIYTRVDGIEKVTDDKIRVRLKPAASLELRGSEKDGSKLIKRPISNQFDGNTITKRRGKYGYTATVGMEILKELGLEHKEHATVYPFVSDGRLALRVEPTESEHSMVTRIDSTGLIGIPSGIGAVGDLDGHGVEWELDEQSNSIVGYTTAAIEDISFTGRRNGSSTTITKVEQSDVSHEGRSWTQRHYKCYLRVEHVDSLGWRDDMYVDMHFVDVNGNLGLKVTDNVREKYVSEQEDGSVKTSPSVRKLYETDNNQLNFYMPNGIVSSMELGDDKFYWLVDSDSLFGCRTRDIFDEIHADN